jgi:hypothetical protein
MVLVQAFPNGTTIELGEDDRGNQFHRVCNSGGSMCRYTEPFHCALTYAEQYEEFYQVKPDN